MPAYSHPMKSASDTASLRRALNATTHPARLRPAILMAGLTTGAVLAAASLVVSALLVQRFVDERSGLLTTALIAAGTLTGACLGSWASQPAVTRLVTRLLTH